jgi:hypothetical protein
MALATKEQLMRIGREKEKTPLSKTPLSGDRRVRLLRAARDLYDRKKKAVQAGC